MIFVCYLAIPAIKISVTVGTYSNHLKYILKFLFQLSLSLVYWQNSFREGMLLESISDDWFMAD